jgi:preprotein translocase subunit SecG
MQDFLADFSMLLLAVISALLILVVLLQRGRGGGLAGAFGGLGGQSAFGTKAGDVFTKITIGLVTAWVLLAGVSGVLARKASEKGDFADVIVEDEDSEETGGGMSSMSTGEDEGTTGDDSATDEPAGDSTSDDATSSDDKGTEEAAPSGSEPESKPADAKDDTEATPSEAETAKPDDKK